MYVSAESENLESLRILAYLVDTGHVPPSALREASEMQQGTRFPYYLPNAAQASSILRLLAPSHPYHQQAAK
tara:strand:+ start:312 stop:527 length:216 start_codon:yes stop_codon:yes gene_type:complete